MPIYHMKRYKKNFTIIGNEIINDGNLSALARFVLIFLLSKPTKWRVSAREVSKSMGLGRYVINNCMRELVKHGYAELQRIQYDNGKFKGSVWVVSDTPNTSDLNDLKDSTESLIFGQSENSTVQKLNHYKELS